MLNEKSDSPELDVLKKELQTLNERLNIVESQLHNIAAGKHATASHAAKNDDEFEIHLPFESKGSIEFRVGEYGMAWLGNIVLLFGITFLIQYLHKTGNPLISVIIGAVAIGGIFFGAFLLKNTYSYLAKLLSYSAHLLLFYLVLRLHFVSENSIIQNTFPELLILTAILCLLLFFSVKEKSQFKTGFVLTMIIVAGIISNANHFLLDMSTLTALVSVFLYYRLGWLKLVMFLIFCTYFAQLLWLLNNPLITGEPVLIDTNSYGYLYLIVSGLIFSLLAIIPQRENISNEIVLGTIIWNGLGFTALLLLTVVTYFHENYILIFGGITIFCLIYSLILQYKSYLKLSASFYAIYGFVSMSIVIFGIYNFPKAYLLLSLQSFLVVSMALLFRSRFLVVVNTLLFLLLLICYIKDPVVYNSTNFSFLLVAFVSARVMNWKKERLSLKTELVRNIYLVAGFPITLIALYHLAPDYLITVSWISMALLFFLFSRLINNIKYRWLAIATILASAIHLVFVDMSKMNLIYRILVFLLMAVISITVSIVYTKYFNHKKLQDK